MVTDLLAKLLPDMGGKVYFYEQDFAGSGLIVIEEYSGRTK